KVDAGYPHRPVQQPFEIDRLAFQLALGRDALRMVAVEAEAQLAARRARGELRAPQRRGEARTLQRPREAPLEQPAPRAQSERRAAARVLDRRAPDVELARTPAEVECDARPGRKARGGLERQRLLRTPGRARRRDPHRSLERQPRR